MANPRKTYFLTPSFDFPPPPTGPIKLGNILTDPSSPDRPLNPPSTDPPGNTSNAPPPDLITTTVKNDWKTTLSASNKASIGLYAKFLDVVLGAGADASVNFDHGTENKYSFDRIETTWFNPIEGKAYINSLLARPKISEYLSKRTGWGKHAAVYVITGLKIVRGGTIKTSKTRGHGGALSIGLDGSGVAVPVEAGPEIEVQRERGEETEWGGGDDFVFAYRVSRIKVKRKTGEVKEEEYTKGALYGLREDADGNVIEDADVGLEVGEVEGDEAVAAEYGEEEVAVVGDDEEGECVCVLP